MSEATRSLEAAPVSGSPGLATSGSAVRGGAWSVAARVAGQLQLLGLSIVLARFLGPSDMGRQSYIAFVAISLATVATAGMPAALVRFSAVSLGERAGGVARTLYAWTWRVETALAALGALGLAAVAALGADPPTAWVLAGLGTAAAVLQTVPSALLVAAQRWREASVVSLVTGTVGIAAVAAVLAAGGGITGYFGVELALFVVNLAVTAVLARRVVVTLPEPAPVRRAHRRAFVAFAGGTTVLVLVQFVVWQRSELFVLDRVSSNAEIAVYSIGFAAVAGLSSVPEALARVATPMVATLVGAGELERIRSGYWRAVRLLLLATPPIAVGAALVGPELLRLAYGAGYAGAGDVARVLLVPLLLLPLSTLAGAVLLALGRLRFLLLVGLAATLIDLGLAVLLVPGLDAVGAAMANGAAQLCAGIPALVLAARILGPPEIGLDGVARGVLAAAVVAAVTGASTAGLGGVAGVVVGASAGIAAWLAAARVLRPLAAADAAWLADGLSPRRAGLAAFLDRIAA